MAIQRTALPMSRKSPPVSMPRSGWLLHSPAVRTGTMMASFGALLGIGTVVLEQQRGMAFGLGLTLGIVMLPWLLAMMRSSAHLLAQPGGMCALLLGAGVQVALAGLYSGRTIPLAIGAMLAIGSVTVWIAATFVPR